LLVVSTDLRFCFCCGIEDWYASDYNATETNQISDIVFFCQLFERSCQVVEYASS